MNNWTDNKLKRMSEAYFDGTLSEAEEAELRQQLAASNTDEGVIGEAKAVMGVFAVARKQQRKIRKQGFNRPVAVISAAAAIAVLLIIAFGRSNYATDADFIMYAQGRVITSEETVLTEMHSQLTEMGRQSDDMDRTISSQLGDFKSLLNDK